MSVERMSITEIQDILSARTGRKVEFTPSVLDPETRRFTKFLFVDGRRIKFKWHPSDDGGEGTSPITMEDLIESLVIAINQTFAEEE